VRFLILTVLIVGILAVLGAGLLPPVFDQGSLDTDALNAARAASSASQSGNDAAIEAAAARSIAGDPGVALVWAKPVPSNGLPTIQVRLSETVHTFMDGFPGLKSWFRLTSTQESEAGQ
jgi:type II secretory pathway pseudopilin PulG